MGARRAADFGRRLFAVRGGVRIARMGDVTFGPLGSGTIESIVWQDRRHDPRIFGPVELP